MSKQRHQSDLLHGTLNLLILRAVSGRSLHGADVASWIAKRSGGEFEIVDAALYKALHRLEEAGAIAAREGRSATNRFARFYTLTARGRRLLREQSSAWDRYAQAVFTVLAPECDREPAR